MNEQKKFDMSEGYLAQLIYDAYKRGFEWAEENRFNGGYLNKAAADYADKTMYQVSEDHPSPANHLNQ